VYRHKDSSTVASKTQPGSNLITSNEGLKVTDQFLALLLVIVSESGLINVSWDYFRDYMLRFKTRAALTSSLDRKALVGILEEEDCDPNISRKATLLLGEILYMSNRLLPLPHAAKLQVRCRVLQGLQRWSTLLPTRAPPDPFY
jgi:hypothetical protein